MSRQMNDAPEFSVDSLSKDDRLWAVLAHLSGVVGALASINLLPFLGPLVIWLVKKDEIPFVDENGKESLNFQISMTIYAIFSAVLCLVVIGFLLLLILFIFDLVLVIIASVEASKGKSYRYPLTIRLIN